MSSGSSKAVLLTAALLTAAGCGTAPGTGDAPAGPPSTERQAQPPSGTAFNQADVAFARGMVPHHRQAVEMADMVRDRAADPAVLDLAGRIRAAQQPEIDRLSAWLREWNPPPVPPGGGHGQHGHAGMTGMMSEHHRGAVEMARTELASGRHTGARAMAESIISTQRAEIGEMTALLDRS